ncbi:MAG TPA: glycosyltransferase family 2 protein [Patescibacteria group bacterium]|nr:glycosyltransferase family 2 protein [Patescibacteria group bacterium]
MKNTKQPLVSIVIPTYNRKEMAAGLIKSILKSTYKNLELIVVDDASTDGTSQYLSKKFGKNKKIIIRRNKTNMFAAGSKNEGQKMAHGKYIAFIDDDNVVDKLMIEKLISLLDSDPSIGEVGPVNYVMGKKNKVLLTRSTRNMWTTKTNHIRSLEKFRSQKFWETDDIPNAFIVRADILKQNKISFRPYFGIMYEESDFAYRIRLAGYKIMIVKDAKIYHGIEIADKDYVYHYLSDPRRSFVFARNRIVFHSLYSTFVQNIFIFSFWIWFFCAVYVYKFITYSGLTNFSFKNKIITSLKYLNGTISGINFVFLGKESF